MAPLDNERPSVSGTVLMTVGVTPPAPLAFAANRRAVRPAPRSGRYTALRGRRSAPDLLEQPRHEVVQRVAPGTPLMTAGGVAHAILVEHLIDGPSLGERDVGVAVDVVEQLQPAGVLGQRAAASRP